MARTFSIRTVTPRKPLVTITAETRDAIARAIEPVVSLAPGRDWEAMLAAVMTALHEANAWDLLERRAPRAANRREQVRAVAEACRVLRTRLRRLSEGAVFDLSESDGPGMRESLAARMAARIEAAMKSLDPVASIPVPADPVASILVPACELMERRATATAARLDRHREFKPRSEARLILIHRLRDIYFGFSKIPTNSTTERGRALAQANFVRAIFKAAGVTCHAALVANCVKELEAKDLDHLSGNLG